MSVAVLRERLAGMGYQVRSRSRGFTTEPQDVAEVLGGEVRENSLGQVVVFEQLLPMPMVGPSDSAAWRSLWGGADEAGPLCFLDTETTGLSSGAGTQAFLVAMAWRQPDGLLFRQYLLADPAEEEPLLHEVCRDLKGSGALVTYNGRTFDAPVLASRLVLWRQDSGVLDLPHFDLLHPVRRIYKTRIGACNLSAVEDVVLGRDRGDDIPGYLIPDSYFTFLRQRDPEVLREVIAHNRQDVVSLSLLLDHLLRAVISPGELHPLDRMGIARVHEVAGEPERGLEIYRALWGESFGGWDGEVWPGGWTPVEMAYVVGLRLAARLRRRRIDDEADSVLAELWRRHRAPWEAGIMLAKQLEHRRKDCSAALEVVVAAREALETQPGRQLREERWLTDLRKREARLQRRTAA